MYAGRPLERAPTRELFAAPQHPYTWGLLQSMPTIERRLEQLVPIEGSPPSLISPPRGCPFHPRCAYRFADCEVELPAETSVPRGHVDRCLLTPDRKRAEWLRIDAARLGATG